MRERHDGSQAAEMALNRAGKVRQLRAGVKLKAGGSAGGQRLDDPPFPAPWAPDQFLCVWLARMCVRCVAGIWPFSFCSLIALMACRMPVVRLRTAPFRSPRLPHTARKAGFKKGLVTEPGPLIFRAPRIRAQLAEGISATSQTLYEAHKISAFDKMRLPAPPDPRGGLTFFI